ncbi:uncharacterized protein JCM6883_005238 [Sporobolomyces salmoneus]|uniref:uncharacterized protein n=1 Tax=Sporobolomyces salmoneus TaxID=183962 RepID=UPI003171EA12
MPADKYYGFEDQALLCEHVITSLFSVGPQPPTRVGIDTPPLSPKSAGPQVPQLGEFIAYALYRTRLPVSITHQALLLLTRLKTRYPSARGTSTSPHRLFLSSLMLSSKISMDDTYSNKSWQIVGQGLFELKEVNQMERELFAFLGWNVVVRDEELAAWVEDVVTPYETERSLAASLASLAAAQQSDKVVVSERKRSRENSSPRLPTPAASPSPSRSPSPDSIARHRRASDAAVALLHGGNMPTGAPKPRFHPSTSAFDSTPSTSASSSPSRSSRRLRRPDSRCSPYSGRDSSRSSSRAPSTVASSCSSSPAFGNAGLHTPVSPCTPAGPLTPESAPTKSVWPTNPLASKVAPSSASIDDHSTYVFPQPSQSHPHVVEPDSVVVW